MRGAWSERGEVCFFAEVLARISVDEVRDRVLSTIETKLSATEAPTSFEGEPS